LVTVVTLRLLRCYVVCCYVYVAVALLRYRFTVTFTFAHLRTLLLLRLPRLFGYTFTFVAVALLYVTVTLRYTRLRLRLHTYVTLLFTLYVYVCCCVVYVTRLIWLPFVAFVAHVVTLPVTTPARLRVTVALVWLVYVWFYVVYAFGLRLRGYVCYVRSRLRLLFVVDLPTFTRCGYAFGYVYVWLRLPVYFTDLRYVARLDVCSFTLYVVTFTLRYVYVC